MRWLRILSTYEFDIHHQAGTKHGTADSLSQASHAPFLSKREAAEVLADDQILALGEALEDDGQESKRITILLTSLTVKTIQDSLCQTSFLFPRKSRKRL